VIVAGTVLLLRETVPGLIAGTLGALLQPALS
jgi:hypothetical protein